MRKRKQQQRNYRDEMRIEKKNISGNPFIGILSSTNNEITLVPPSTQDGFVKLVKDVLRTKVIKATLYDSSLLGVFSVMNDNGILVPKTVYDSETDFLKKYFDKIGVLQEFTAIGNLITCNNKGCIVSHVFSENDVHTIEEVLNVDVIQMKLAGLDVVGSCVVANDKGFLANPNITDEELKTIKKALKVDGTVGSVNYGSPFIKGGLIANNEGAITGMLTTAYEFGRIDEALFFGRE